MKPGPAVAAALTSSWTRRLGRGLAEATRRLRRVPHRVHYFHQVDDPYSHLAAQTLALLLERYEVVLEPHLVGPPPDEAAPERARLEAFARRDAADVAPGYGLRFPVAGRAGAGPAAEPQHAAGADGIPAPAPADVALARRILAAALAPGPATGGRFATLAPLVGSALWRGDRRALESVAKEAGAAPEADAEARVAAGNALRAERSHYLGAMFLYGESPPAALRRLGRQLGGVLGAEWYWGVDRLHHLERRLRALGLQRAQAPEGWIAPRPELSWRPPQGAAEERPVLEFYPSLRSPYTYIAMERVYALAARLGVELVLRPVLPMVMRGLPVPAAKRLYITLDTRREAEDAGVPFGRIADPVGRPVERAFTLFPYAREQGRGAAFLLEFARAAFAEGVDTGSDAGLEQVVERAGLSFAEARKHLDQDSCQDELEANRRQLFDMGLWGVPSFRVLGPGDAPAWCTWGQDRLWRVEQELRRRLGETPHTDTAGGAR